MLDPEGDVQMTKDQLVRRIIDVFASVPYPRDQVSDREEGRALDYAFDHKNWPRASTRDFFVMHLDDINYLSPAGFRYYLPVVLIGFLDFPDDGDIIWEHLFGILTPKKWMSKEATTDLLLDLSLQEQNVVREFFTFLYDQNCERFSEEVLDALTGCWSNT